MRLRAHGVHHQNHRADLNSRGCPKYVGLAHPAPTSVSEQPCFTHSAQPFFGGLPRSRYSGCWVESLLPAKSELKNGRRRCMGVEPTLDQELYPGPATVLEDGQAANPTGDLSNCQSSRMGS